MGQRETSRLAIGPIQREFGPFKSQTPDAIGQTFETVKASGPGKLTSGLVARTYS